MDLEAVLLLFMCPPQQPHPRAKDHMWQEEGSATVNTLEPDPAQESRPTAGLMVCIAWAGQISTEPSQGPFDFCRGWCANPVIHGVILYVVLASPSHHFWASPTVHRGLTSMQGIGLSDSGKERGQEHSEGHGQV